jgi:hypothetical protein
MSEGIGNPLLYKINLSKWQMFVKVLPMTSDHLPEDINNPLEQFAECLG